MNKKRIKKAKDIKNNSSKLMSDNLVGGFAWGVGAIIGAFFLITILGKLNLIPFKLLP